jgi:hypothetical protein
MSLKLRCIEDNECQPRLNHLSKKQVAPDWWLARGPRSAAATATGDAKDKLAAKWIWDSQWLPETTWNSWTIKRQYMFSQGTCWAFLGWCNQTDSTTLLIIDLITENINIIIKWHLGQWINAKKSTWFKGHVSGADFGQKQAAPHRLPNSNCRCRRSWTDKRTRR